MSKNEWKAPVDLLVRTICETISPNGISSNFQQLSLWLRYVFHPRSHNRPQPHYKGSFSAKFLATFLPYFLCSVLVFLTYDYYFSLLFSRRLLGCLILCCR